MYGEYSTVFVSTDYCSFYDENGQVQPTCHQVTGLSPMSTKGALQYQGLVLVTRCIEKSCC